MEIEKLVVGQMAENCYLIWDKETKEAVLLDPGDDADYIMRRITDLQLKPVYILATHGHFDHLLAVLELKLAYSQKSSAYSQKNSVYSQKSSAYGIPFLIHKKDLFLLKLVQRSVKHFLGIKVDPVPLPDRFLKDGEEIKFGKEKLRVMETPGHTPGSVCLYTPRHPELGSGSIFTGDTVFAEGVGRTDFSYSSKEDLANSLKKILKLSDKTLVYPGHGEKTTIGILKGIFPVSTSSG